MVSRSRGPKDQDISNSHSNTSLTLKKVHLVILFFKINVNSNKLATDDDAIFGSYTLIIVVINIYRE